MNNINLSSIFYLRIYIIFAFKKVSLKKEKKSNYKIKY